MLSLVAIPGLLLPSSMLSPLYTQQIPVQSARTQSRWFKLQTGSGPPETFATLVSAPFF